MVAATGYDGLALWELANENHRCLARVPKPFRSAAFAPDGKTLATSDHEGHVLVWRVAKLLERHPGN
jgi:hypothetical protein